MSGHLGCVPGRDASLPAIERRPQNDCEWTKKGGSHEVHAFRPAHRSRHARRPQAASSDRAQQRALPADARRDPQARRVRRRCRLRRDGHHRASFPFRGLRDVGGAAAALRRPRRAHQAHQVLAARAGAAVVGSDPRRRGAGGARPSDQGPHLCRLRPRLSGSLGQRARPAVPRDRRADGRLLDRQPQPQGLRGDAEGHQEGLDRGVLRLRRRVLQGALSLQGGHHPLAGARVDARPTARPARSTTRASSARSASCPSPTSSRTRRCSSPSR